jgi:hypothetical protein
MAIKSFAAFIKTNENSDLDWSDKNFDEAGVDGANPPNSGFEGTSAEQMDYTAGDYGETADEDSPQGEDDPIRKEIDTAPMKMVKSLIDDLTERIESLEKIKDTNHASNK